MTLALPLGGLEVLDRSRRCSADRRRQGRSEDKSGSIGTDCIDQIAAAGDIPAETSERLGKCAFNDVDAVHHTIARGHTRATRSIHPHRMNFIAVGQGTIALGQIANSADWGDVAGHGVQTFEHNQFRSIRRFRSQQTLEIDEVIVAPDFPIHARLTDSRDHRMWLSSSDKMRQSGISLAMVEMLAWFET